MITKIGIIAGEIWDFLEQNERVSLKQLTQGIDHSQDLVLMSLGWLAREGHVVVDSLDGEYEISLRKDIDIKLAEGGKP